jgi:hypothetical protein
MEMELKAFLGSGRKSFLLGVSIIRELDGFVDGREMNKGREQTNPVKSTGQDVVLGNILVDIVSNESIFSWLNTFNCDGNVHNDSNKSEAKREATTSLATAHSPE